MIATRNWDEATVLRMRWWTLTVLCLSFVIIAINVMTLTVAVPELIVVFGATTSQIQWVVAIYSIAFAAFVITAGAISDRFGRKRILLTGLILFGVISGVGAFAQTAQQLTIARAGLGLAAAMIMPGTLSILVAAFRLRSGAKLVAGALLIPSSIAWNISSLFVFRFVERFGYRLVITVGLAIGAVGFAVLLGVSAGPSELIVVLAMAVIGTGLGTATTPASVLLVSALPQEKAGVGSAINDVTREAGTAIGVAIFGSVLAAVYTTTMSGNTAELAASQSDVAKDSLPGALAVAGRIGGKVGEELSAASTAAFDSGVHLVVVICVATVAALALLTYFFIGEDRPIS